MAATASYPVRSPQWILSYLGVNITADVSQMVLAIRYVDRLDGASGELEVDLEDSTKLWQGPWYPALGDIVSLQIGYSGEALLDCGEFQIDELELDGPPDVMRLRCLAAYITPAMRTANTVAYENMGIVEIAALIAAKYGLVMVTASSESESDVGVCPRYSTAPDGFGISETPGERAQLRFHGACEGSWSFTRGRCSSPYLQ